MDYGHRALGTDIYTWKCKLSSWAFGLAWNAAKAKVLLSGVTTGP
jgi:hypothetical protein